ncbi:MAG: COQ9 family protein [Anaplasma sp.]
MECVPAVLCDSDERAMHRITEETIALIPSLGVRDSTLLEACKRLGVENSFCKFPEGIVSVLRRMNGELIRSVTSAFQSINQEELPRMRDKVGHLVKLCILHNISLPNSRQLIKSILCFAMLPQNMRLYAQLTFEVADMVWHLAGDSSTNFKYYTKRTTVAWVYVSSLIYLTRDFSEGFSATFAFMERRIADVLVLQKLKGSIGSRLAKAFSAFAVRFD